MSRAAADADAADAPGGSGDGPDDLGSRKGGGFLDLIERVGNKVPHPALLFMVLSVAVILLSQVLSWANVSVTYEVVKPPAALVEE